VFATTHLQQDIYIYPNNIMKYHRLLVGGILFRSFLVASVASSEEFGEQWNDGSG
jgi:hypothetical protein